MATVLTLIWSLYGYRFWKRAKREGNFALI
jgi:hypothetical protein